MYLYWFWNYRVKAIRKFLKSNLDLGYVVGECFGYGVDFEYRPYSTVVRSAGIMIFWVTRMIF